MSERFRVLLLGGSALIFYGRERPTFDADIWLEPMSDAQVWAMALTTAFGTYEEIYLGDLAARRRAAVEEVADLAEAFGVVRIGGLSENLDVFRRPNNFAEEEFEAVWNASKPFVGERLRVLHEVDLLATKMETERAKDFEDVAFLEARIRQDIGSRLAVCAPDEAAALFARYADHVTCAAALINPHPEVRARWKRCASSPPRGILSRGKSSPNSVIRNRVEHRDSNTPSPLARRVEPEENRATSSSPVMKTKTLLACVGFLVSLCALSCPTKVSAAAGDLYEADFSGGIIYKFAPDGTRSVFASGLNGPEGLAFDTAGNVFVSETGTGIVYKYAAGSGGGTRTVFASGLNGPASLVFDGAGNLFDADFFGGVLYRFAADGSRTTFATGLNGPANLLFDRAGNLFEADFQTGNVFRFAPDGTRTNFASGVGKPHGLAFDSSGNLFVADFEGGRILRFTPDGGTRTTFATGLNGPHGLAFDAAGNLFSADYNSGAVYRFDPSGARTTFATGLSNPANVLFEPVLVNHPPFFNGEIPLSNGVFFLRFAATGNSFGYYSYLSDPRFIYHFDLGYEYWFDAQNSQNGIFFYDFASQSFFYTAPSFPFPYLYDFSLNAILYYYPDPSNPERYNTNGTRYFFNFATGQIIVK